MDDLARNFLGIVCCELALKWVFDGHPARHVRQLIFKLGGLILYVLTSHKLTAKPDYSNVSWLGGLLDDPFRSSDNINCWLVYIQLLLPGKLTAYSLVMGWFFFQSIYKKPRK